MALQEGGVALQVVDDLRGGDARGWGEGVFGIL
jgi:hypothetical protein